jgi:hypothetical protein
MPERIPASIAKRVVFRAIASADHYTPKTAVTIAITISKNGGAFGNPAAGATNATEISSGFYYFDLGTGDTGTSGPLAWRGAVATIDDVGDVYEVVAATNGGFTALPAVAAGSSGGVPLIGTGTNNFKSDASANVTFANTTIATVTTVTNQLTAAQVATGVWQDATAGDFTVASSIGKALYIANIAPGASGGHLISGSNAGTTTLAALTITGVTTFTGATTHTGAVSYANGITVAGGTGVDALSLTGANGGSGLKAAGTGAGHGIYAIAGATAAYHGIYAYGNAGNGSHGLYGLGAGTGTGIKAEGGAASNSNGFEGQGVGTGGGMHLTGGAGTSGHGLHCEAGASGAGIYAQGTGATRYGIEAVGVGASDSGGFKAYATTDGEGIEAVAVGSGRHGFYVIGGSGTGKGIYVDDIEVTGTTVLTGAVSAPAGITANITGNITGTLSTVTTVTGFTASNVGDIKTKTDSLTFTQAGMVDANIQRINDVLITGDGQTGTEFGV